MKTFEAHMKYLALYLSILVISCQGSKSSHSDEPNQPNPETQEGAENGMDLNLVLSTKETDASCDGIDFKIPEAASEQMQTYVFRLGLINSDQFKGKSIDEIEQWFQRCMRRRFP